MRVWILAPLFCCSACVSTHPDHVEDPIDGVAADQQSTIMRRTVDPQWPLTVGKGTLGCRSGAVLFRAAGRTYALNDAARAQGFDPVQPIVAQEPSRPPSNPLRSRTQEERMRVFADYTACAVSTDCALLVGARHHLTPAELRQIFEEGNERVWPPLKRSKASVQPLIDRGLKLCKS